MIHENDKLVIPEKYQRMSVSELVQEKEKLYEEIQRKPKQLKTKKKSGEVKFHF